MYGPGCPSGLNTDIAVTSNASNLTSDAAALAAVNSSISICRISKSKPSRAFSSYGSVMLQAPRLSQGRPSKCDGENVVKITSRRLPATAFNVVLIAFLNTS
ncbi:hypothetical protein CARUB_v10021200mg [Capsella rubella]|uniref:Uncharacterized protein n=1 Tax=Capsella rubella TaxID=81985 RepID=R0IGK1_9BRAS|nr:hypothetical protein CARUB_v10021200mg [Capsella rubella]